MRSLLAVMLVLVPGLSVAQSLVITAPAAPGGGWDQTARAMQRALAEIEPGLNVQVENVPGAAGTIGLARFIQSERGNPDALLVTGLVMVSGVITSHSPVSLADATPIARLTGEYEIIVVPAASPYQSLTDLVAAFRKDPGSISWGGGSAGGTDDLLVRLLAEQIGLPASSVNYIAFSGGGAALAAVLGGQVSAAVSGYAEFAGQIAAGQLRILAVSAPSRVAGIDAPTLRDAGIALDLANWRAIVAPPGLSDAEEAALVRTNDDDGHERAVAGDAREKRLGRSVPCRPAVSPVPALRTVPHRGGVAAFERDQHRRRFYAVGHADAEHAAVVSGADLRRRARADADEHIQAPPGLRCIRHANGHGDRGCRSPPCRSSSSRWDSLRHRRCCSPSPRTALRGQRPATRALMIDLAVGAVFSIVLFVTFTRGLGVSLPGFARLLMSELLAGFAVALTPANLLWALAGATLGTAVGVLPGIGPALTVALLLPITYGLDPTAALIMFAGIYYGAMYGGSTTSILLNTPGESATIVTAIDGHQMARNGRAGAALATAAIGSFVAGTLATLR